MSGPSNFTMDDDTDENTCFDGSRKNEEVKSKVEIAHVLLSFALAALLVGLYGAVYGIDKALPTPLRLSDEERHPEAFIAERASHDLKNITDLGPRVAGESVNEVQTVQLLKSKLAAILENAHPNQKIELDEQLVSGSHFLNRTPSGSIMVYSNLQNIAVKLHGVNASHSVLVNAHFDSVPTSPGASDDAINCAVMLEILRKVSKAPLRPLNSVVFLFNGAEEPGLQASHGFITQHKWAKECKVVLNLEAAGAGGKSILFQTGPAAPWLMKYYHQVPHPYGQAAGEEIFQSNIVPSDTDFRIFRDYGGLVGLDMAFFKRGYVYHTKYDNFEGIPPGSIQQVGDNALSLVADLGDAPEVADPKSDPGKVVFYDFLGLFLVSYSLTWAHVINYIVVILSFAMSALSIYSFRLGRRCVWYFLLTFGAIIGGWVFSAIFVVLLALFIDQIGFAMSWYANPWLIFGLYTIPTVVLSSILFPFVNDKRIDEDTKCQIQVHCLRFIWTSILFIGTILNIRAMYALLIPVLFTTLAFIVLNLLRFKRTNKLVINETVSPWKQNCKKIIPIKQWQIIYMISLVIPTLFLMYCKLTTLSLFVPITGRIGPDKNADLLVGVIALLFTILIASSFTILVTSFKNIKFLHMTLGVVFLTSFIIIFTPLGFPYSGNKDSPAPQRYWIIHTSRRFNFENGSTKNDSGYFLLNMDRNSPFKLRNYVKEISNYPKSLEDDCNSYLMCGVPIVHSKMIEIIKYSTWIPAKPPQIAGPKFSFSKTQLSPSTVKYSVDLLGSDRMAVYISPKSDVKILNISLLSKLTDKEKTAVWNGRDFYYILFIYGKTAAHLKFSFDVELPSGNFTGATTELGLCTVNVHDQTNRRGPHYAQFLQQFPDWTDVTAWAGSFESWWV